MLLRIAITTMACCLASPALAGGAAQVPEGSSITLFAMGAAGVIIGRRLSIRRSKQDRRED